MDGVGSTFAVVSLAIQLVETGEKISSFFASVQDAPSEVISLAQTLDQLNSTLNQVSYLLDQQYLARRLPGSPVFMTNALKNCEKRMRTLESVTLKAKTAMDHRSRVHRSLAAMRFVSKKEDIREMQSQLRDAEAGLQTAMLSNSWQLQMHAISISSSGALQTTYVEQPPQSKPINSVVQHESVRSPSSIHKGNFRTTAEETNFVWYRGLFGRVDVHFKLTSLSTSKRRRPGERAMSQEKSIKITPIFLHKTFELRFLDSFNHISRTLKTYPILDRSAPIFETCRNGDLEGLQVALSSGTISPFARNEFGGTLLHYAALFGHVDVCALLLQLGVDPGLTGNLGIKAMSMVYATEEALLERGGEGFPERAVNTVRLLLQSQNDISSQDMAGFWMYFSGPVNVAEFLYWNDSVPSESDGTDGEEMFPLLAMSLREFGRDPPQWASFLRLLLGKRAGLHSRVPRSNELLMKMYPCKVSEYGTPLDELFSHTKLPFEGEAVANLWLQILLSEGFDVVEYLEEEYALHAQQMQLTVPCVGFFFDDAPRQLIYHGGSTPSVSWDWWIDPNSSTYLVREEFKHINIFHDDTSSQWYEWKSLWPLKYQLLCDRKKNFLDDSDRRLPSELARERANKRSERKSKKVAQAQGLKKRDRMPGAWPV